MARAREFRSPKELEWTFWISNGAPRLRPELDLFVLVELVEDQVGEPDHLLAGELHRPPSPLTG